MKTRLLSLAAFFLSIGMSAQTVSTFESLTLAVDSFWNGSDLSGSFSNGNAAFKNEYTQSQWGDYWSGFSYTNKKDSTTAGYSNQYSARTAVGYNNSSNYVVAYGSGSQINLTGAAAGKIASGFYVTNTTYAALSMAQGDAYAKKFGGVSGNDSDWFMITVKGWFNGSAITDTVNFYLADFRSSDNSKDYILKTWEWVDLTSLGNVDSLTFSFSSSDNGQYGMNTPAYFAMDNFTTIDFAVAVNEVSKLEFSVYPNPVSSVFTLNSKSLQNTMVTIFDAAGRVVLVENKNGLSKSFDVSSLTSGVYFISVSGNEFSTTKKFIKE